MTHVLLTITNGYPRIGLNSTSKIKDSIGQKVGKWPEKVSNNMSKIANNFNGMVWASVRNSYMTFLKLSQILEC